MSDGGTSRIIEAFSINVGRATAWLTLLMVIITFAIVVMRYIFGTGFIWMQQSLSWMHAAVFMLGAAYTLQADEHVRVDIFYRGTSENRRAWVNLVGVLLFVFPLCITLFYQSYAYVSISWSIGEISRDAGGLPYPAIPLLKSFLFLMPLTVSLQGLSLLLQSLHTIRTN